MKFDILHRILQVFGAILRMMKSSMLFRSCDADVTLLGKRSWRSVFNTPRQVYDCSIRSELTNSSSSSRKKPCLDEPVQPPLVSASETPTLGRESMDLYPTGFDGLNYIMSRSVLKQKSSRQSNVNDQHASTINGRKL